jgi:hypothetical protein
LCSPEELSANVTDGSLDTDIPQLLWGDTVTVADFIEKNFVLKSQDSAFLPPKRKRVR